METSTTLYRHKQQLLFYNSLEFNDIYGPINKWEKISLLERPTFEEVLGHAEQIIQGDVCIARTQQTRNAYLHYASELAQTGRRPVNDIIDAANGSSYFILPNRFPYDLADAEHWLLFLMQEQSTLNGAQEYLMHWCAERQIGINQVFAYQNPHGLRSMPELPHFQLILQSQSRI